MGPLTSCAALGWSGSAAQRASAFSSATVSPAGSIQAPAPSTVANASAVTTPVPRPQLPRMYRPTRPPPWACSASHAGTSPGPRTRVATSKPSSASGSAMASAVYSRSRSVRNWRVSKSWWTASRSHGRSRRSAGEISNGTSRASSVRVRLRITLARCARSEPPTLPPTSSARSTSSASEPNC